MMLSKTIVTNRKKISLVMAAVGIIKVTRTSQTYFITFKIVGMASEWHFFATSHCKNACDGIGGTIKCLAAYTSLQTTIKGLILTPFTLFTFADNEIPGINSFFVSLA